MFREESIYIAGPECFYKNGTALLAAMRAQAEAYGFRVTLPNDTPLKLDHEDRRKNADAIFANLEEVMNETTVIIADLEAFRGAEADSGTIYEIGMAYARGARCYGYTRDKRTLAQKNHSGYLKDGILYDEHDEVMPYPDLPFSPAVIGATKIVEGDFYDCLHMLMNDIEEEYKAGTYMPLNTWEVPAASEKAEPPVIYLAGTQRYRKDAEAYYEKMKALCESYGMKALTPMDPAGAERSDPEAGRPEHPYERAGLLTRRYAEHIARCDMILADLNDFRGYEMANDIGFECGIAFQLGKQMYGYMDDVRPMKYRVAHLGEEAEYRDQAGCNVENFDYPVNLMFSSSMEIIAGDAEAAIRQAAEQLNGEK